MNIICPHCNFSKTVDPAKVPERPVKVNCPKCGQGFNFDNSVRPDDSLPAAPVTNVSGGVSDKKTSSPPAAVNSSGRRIICNACGAVQAPAAHCVQCGATITTTASPVQNQSQSYAGFWVRTVAYILDFVLLGFVQLVLSVLIDQVIALLGIAAEGDPAVNMVIWLFGASLSIGYAVFFTGYCGQTPGKMALRIKVIRTDGSPVSYGRAVLREVPGKFLSSILLGIGYLMVAFDNKKQGLHDKIAATYVIKL
jgi:predicted Zn finger-like uncharacterized protein